MTYHIWYLKVTWKNGKTENYGSTTLNKAIKLSLNSYLRVYGLSSEDLTAMTAELSSFDCFTEFEQTDNLSIWNLKSAYGDYFEWGFDLIDSPSTYSAEGNCLVGLDVWISVYGFVEGVGYTYDTEV